MKKRKKKLARRIGSLILAISLFFTTNGISIAAESTNTVATSEESIIEISSVEEFLDISENLRLLLFSVCQILSNDVKISEKQGNEFNLNRRKGKLTNISVFFFLKKKFV